MLSDQPPHHHQQRGLRQQEVQRPKDARQPVQLAHALHDQLSGREADQLDPVLFRTDEIRGEMHRPDAFEVSRRVPRFEIVLMPFALTSAARYSPAM